MPNSDSEAPPGMPRWVKVFVLVVILLLVVAIMLVAGGDHGPGRHAPGMVTGFALLIYRPDIGRPALGGDTENGPVRVSEEDY